MIEKYCFCGIFAFLFRSAVRRDSSPNELMITSAPIVCGCRVFAPTRVDKILSFYLSALDWCGSGPYAVVSSQERLPEFGKCFKRTSKVVGLWNWMQSPRSNRLCLRSKLFNGVFPDERNFCGLRGIRIAWLLALQVPGCEWKGCILPRYTVFYRGKMFCTAYQPRPAPAWAATQ